jgi:hypothetical protein
MRLQMSLSKEMAEALKAEAKKRKLDSLQETMRAVLSEYFMCTGREKKEKKITVDLPDRNPLAH